jgi:PucR C-terminal helix-turn-helix domain/GGDEF-like domain
MAQPEARAAVTAKQASPGVARLVEGFRARMDEILDESVLAMQEEIPSYRSADSAMLESIREHVRLHFEALLHSLSVDRPMSREDLLFIRPAATHRARAGVPLADFMQAFRIGQREIWRALAAEARNEQTRAAALAAVEQVIEYVNLASTHAAEVYAEVEALLQAQGERVRRDLLAELLEGRVPEPGPRLDAARKAGLEPGARLLVIAAAARAQLIDEHALRSAASAIGRACGGAVAPLAVVRRDEIVVVAPVGGRDLEVLSGALRSSQAKLGESGLPLAIGVSTVQDGLERVPAAYREACAARDRLGARGGVVSLPMLSAFDYLTLMGGETARGLISEAVWEFVQQDLAEGGDLSRTLLAYVAADLNARAASERLHVHVNTAHYRLGKIAERTGCDLRKISDVLELLIAIKLAQGRDPGAALAARADAVGSDSAR